MINVLPYVEYNSRQGICIVVVKCPILWQVLRSRPMIRIKKHADSDQAIRY